MAKPEGEAWKRSLSLWIIKGLTVIRIKLEKIISYRDFMEVLVNAMHSGRSKSVRQKNIENIFFLKPQFPLNYIEL